MDDEVMAPIRQLLAWDRFAEAKELIEVALQKHPEQPLLHAHLAALHKEFGEVDRSRSELIDAADRALRAKDLEAQAFAELWLGYLNNRQGRPQDAVQHFEAAAKIQPPSAELCAVLCQAYVKLRQWDKARAWGVLSLQMRASEANCPAKAKVARNRPRRFNPAARERNVISFSLFGKDPYYQECAVTVARSAKGFFPEFRCWFYCSDDIPGNVRDSLTRSGAKVMMVGTPHQVSQHPFSALFWRFLPFDEAEVDIVLVRDVDSPFTLRERLAIDYWLGTDAPFLTMRDHLNHTEPLMAGMWGGFTELLPPLAQVMFRYRPPGRSKYVDQMFLRRFVWPRICEATLAIDSVYSFGETVDFPAEANRPGSLTVGSGWRRDQILANRDGVP